VKYSSYGVPIGLPGGDTDSDGDCDASDITQVQTWITASAYDVRGDVDLDGDVDASDKSELQTNYQGITLGRGVLSSNGIASRKGYAGYEALSGLSSAKWLARNRTFHPDLGRWGRRDPIKSASVREVYTYGDTDPLGTVDAYGTVATAIDGNSKCKHTVTSASAETSCFGQVWKLYGGNNAVHNPGDYSAPDIKGCGDGECRGSWLPNRDCECDDVDIVLKIMLKDPSAPGGWRGLNAKTTPGDAQYCMAWHGTPDCTKKKSHPIPTWTTTDLWDRPKNGDSEGMVDLELSADCPSGTPDSDTWTVDAPGCHLSLTVTLSCGACESKSQDKLYRNVGGGMSGAGH